MCSHCGSECPPGSPTLGQECFCCRGCESVFQLIRIHGLSDYYHLKDSRGGVPADIPGPPGRFDFLDRAEVLHTIADYADAKRVRVTFRLPGIHCIACVWLLENLGRLHPGVLSARVNFGQKELTTDFHPGRMRCGELAELISSLGYEPDLRFSDIASPGKSSEDTRLPARLGVAGFVFGNTMLFSLAGYLGLDSEFGPAFQKLTGVISILFSLPVVAYCAADYWKTAWIGLRQRRINIEVPIAAGIAALWLQSLHEVVTQTGEGYFDSLAGLLFFLLCGRWFQQRTYAHLRFDRDYRSFFPISVARCDDDGRRIPLSEVRAGDRLRIRHGEIIPSDSRLCSPHAWIDYSFVTGESEPQGKEEGERLFAGGKVIGRAIEIETLKAVSQSYLTLLWNHEAFAKVKHQQLNPITDQYSRRFTRLVLSIALVSGIAWTFVSPAMAVRSFVAVLIVACPCALALAAPFVYGTALRLLSRAGWFVKSGSVLETLAGIDSLVFDKTGTLAGPGTGCVRWVGAALARDEASALRSLAAQSTHPLSARISSALSSQGDLLSVEYFREIEGCGIEGASGDIPVALGSQDWIARKLEIPAKGLNPAPAIGGQHEVHAMVRSAHRGSFLMDGSVVEGIREMLLRIRGHYFVSLVSGDQPRDRARFEQLLGPNPEVHFQQSPLDKLEFVKQWQSRGRRVLFAGDGLNDAGALQQAHVGLAVSQDSGAFCPASDIIVSASGLSELDRVIAFAKASIRIIRQAFWISACYNGIGITIAASGQLSPVVCAVLMPLSSVTVVVFAATRTTLAARTHLGTAAATSPVP